MFIFSLIFSNVVFSIVAETNEANTPKAVIDLFSLLMKSLANAVPESSQGSVSLAYTCHNGTIPTDFDPDSKGMPFVLCNEIDCLEKEKIQCASNVTMDACKGENQWVNGFYEKFENGFNSTKVECCQYNGPTQMRFLRKMNVTKNTWFTRDDSYENEKVVAFNVFNNVEIHSNEKNETIYSISVYQMTCPGITVGKEAITKPNNDNHENEKLEALKSLASSAREIGLKVRNSKLTTTPKPKFDEDSFLSYLTSKNRNPYAGIVATKISQPISFPPRDFIPDGFSNARDYDDDNIIDGNEGYPSRYISWNPYMPKHSYGPQQHIYSNAPTFPKYELFE